MYKSLEEKLDEIRHLEVDLTGDSDDLIDNDVHRPRLSMWAAWHDNIGGPVVSVAIHPLWGQAGRFIDMTPTEARSLATKLIGMSDAIESTVDNHEPLDPPGFEAGFAANH
jgi:hypothetical protein